jgi:hypothetical protein
MSKGRILVALLLVFSLGCGLLGGDGDGADTGDNGGGTGDGGGDDLEIEELAGLDSYRARTMWTWTPDGGETETMVMEEERTREPEASRVAVQMNGEGTEFVQIGDQAWSCFGEVCAQTQADEEDAMSAFGMTVGEWGFDESDLDYRGRETVNGVNTRHYTVDLALSALIALAEGDVSDVEAEAWIVDQSGLPSFVAKYECSWREVRDEQPGAVAWSYEVYDINESFTIEPPEGAASWPEDVPQYPGAADVTLMEGMIAFSTDATAATVADFYGGGLADEGWSMESEMDLGSTLLQTWTKAGKTLNLNITEEDGTTQVVITLG